MSDPGKYLPFLAAFPMLVFSIFLAVGMAWHHYEDSKRKEEFDYRYESGVLSGGQKWVAPITTPYLNVKEQEK